MPWSSVLGRQINFASRQELISQTSKRHSKIGGKVDTLTVEIELTTVATELLETGLLNIGALQNHLG